MNEANENWALIGFTSLAPLSVGGLVGVLWVGAAEAGGAAVMPAVVMLALGILALTVSLMHLGRPLRAPLALLRWSTSWLSREVMLFGLYLAVLTVYVFAAALDFWRQALWPLAVLSALLGLLAVAATGNVYHLRARPIWDHWSAAAAFPLSAGSAGLLLGLAVAESSLGFVAVGGSVTALSAISVLSLILGLWATWFRLGHLASRSEEGLASLRLSVGQYRWAVVLRVAGALCALALLALGGMATTVAWIPAVLGEFADRVLFFCTAVPVTLAARSGARPAGWGLGVQSLEKTTVGEDKG